MRPNRLLSVLLVSALALPATALTQDYPTRDWQTPPRTFVIIPPVTAFPDPVSVSVSHNPNANLTVEGGVSLIAPGAFARAGLAVPLKVSQQDGSDLLLTAGYRYVAIPAIHGTSVWGPTASVGVRSWPRAGGWGWQLNAGAWYGSRPDCDDADCSRDDPRLIPEVRLAYIRAL